MTITTHRSRSPLTAPSLLEDQRGAVMLTGLFMAFCLIGALWYVIGIGEALIFRDRMQEAADSAAFTGAVFNAKGMNFISVCNIIMLILVTVYLVVAVLQDATILTCLACALFCPVCCIACGYVWPAIQANQKTARVVKIGLNVMTGLECAAAIGYPWLGTLKANEVGQQYNVRDNQNSIENDKSTKAQVFALGMSNIPAVGGRWAGPGVPLGLPVEGKEYAELCSKIAEDLLDWLKGLIFGNKGAGAGGPLNELGDAVGKLLGAFVKLRYCNDLTGGVLSEVTDMFGEVRDEISEGGSVTETTTTTNPDGTTTTTTTTTGSGPDPTTGGQINQGAGMVPTARDEDKDWNGWSPWFDPGFDRGWGDPGFLVVHGSAGNGKQPHQVWAINKSPRYNDDNQKKVSFGAHTHDRAMDASQQWQTPQGFGYFAQAEFYFDCEGDWGSDDCNDGDNATFSIRWRARLVRVQMLSLATILQQFLFNGFSDLVGQAVDAAVEGLVNMVSNKFPAIGPMVESAIGQAVIDTASGYLMDLVVDPLLEALDGQLTNLSSTISPTAIEGSYH